MPKLLTPEPTRSIPVGKLMYRFLTGLHMDGKQRKHFHTGKVMPQYKDYFWNRYTRPRRAFLRLLISWLFIAILIGLREERALTTYLMLACVPFIGAYLWYKAVQHFTQLTKYTNGDGVEGKYITLRPKYARRLTKLRYHIRVHAPDDKPVPADWMKPTLAQLAEDGEAPVRQLRMPRTLEDMLAEHGPGGREQTHKRNARRGLKRNA